ncbi:MAG TPA: 50S ribosomal protein L3 [Nannocystaceae bacterium]|nr:50S ribosomal protein L3 [Nannocystaceae bacterium]
MNLQLGLIAKKIGMTQIFLEDGTRVPVTVLAAGGNAVSAHRTPERDGYIAVQLAYGDKKEQRATKAELGHFKAAGVTPRYAVREFRVPVAVQARHPVGTEIPVSIFAEGQLVDVSGTSKGKGFQGVIKRHKMAGEKRSHGQHEFFRHGGSIGCRKTPGRVHPGKRMTGHMGHERVTQQNLKVAKVIADQGLILVKGTVPGANNGYVFIRHAVKPAIAAGTNKA